MYFPGTNQHEQVVGNVASVVSQAQDQPGPSMSLDTSAYGSMENSEVISEPENNAAFQQYASDDELAPYLQFKAPAAIEKSTVTSEVELVAGSPAPVENHEAEQNLSSIFEMRVDDPLINAPSQQLITEDGNDEMEATKDGNVHDKDDYDLFDEDDVSNS